MNDESKQFLIFDSRGNGGGMTCPTLTGDHQNRITDYTAIVVEMDDCTGKQSESCES